MREARRGADKMPRADGMAARRGKSAHVPRLCVRAVLRPRISMLTKSCPRRFRRQQVYTPSTVVPMRMLTGFRGLFAAFVANRRI